ncbi:MAG: hypothetical protein LAO77_24175 [Acidobacteriia bacterium]|nr:hypothetical protein [Terriglobia bacterium]
MSDRDQQAIIARAGQDLVDTLRASRAKNAGHLPPRGTAPRNAAERAAVIADCRSFDEASVRFSAESAARRRLAVETGVAMLRAAAAAGQEWAQTQLRCYEDRVHGNRAPGETEAVAAFARELQAWSAVPPPAPSTTRRTSSAAEIFARFRASESDDRNDQARQEREQRERDHAAELRLIDELAAGRTDVPADHRVVNRARSGVELAAAIYARMNRQSPLISSGGGF